VKRTRTVPPCFASSVSLIVLWPVARPSAGFNALVDSTFEEVANGPAKEEGQRIQRQTDLESKWEEDDRDAGS
jgi:hypothetical protein